jgi:hypothetical protein
MNMPATNSPENPLSVQPEIEQAFETLLMMAYSICSVFSVMSTQIPKLNTMLEDNMLMIGESFSEIAGKSRAQQAKLEAANSSDPILIEVKNISAEISANVNKAIIGMQFQDRVSQNLVILNNLSNSMKDYISYLVETIGNLSKAKQQNSNDEKIFDVEFAKKIVKVFTLGELRDMFVAELVLQGYIKSEKDLGIVLVEQSSAVSADDDIELF